MDTYFRVPRGRLKVRSGPIETALIHYQREESAAVKTSSVAVPEVGDATSLRRVLTAALGVHAVVSKQREIYWIDNVKFHLDTIAGLGTFVEIEAQGTAAEADQLAAQCAEWQRRLGIETTALVPGSYADLIGA